MVSTNQFRQLLDDKTLALDELHLLGVKNCERCHTNLVNIAKLNIPTDLVEQVFAQLAKHLPGVSDPDMAINNLERFFASARSALSLASLFERDQSCVPILLKIFSTSQYLTDLLVNDTESYDSLRLTEGQPIARQILVDELTAELLSVSPDDHATAMTSIRRFKHRETLRIAYGDIVGRQDLQTVVTQISYVADAVCQGALEYCQRWLDEKYGRPTTKTGDIAKVVMIAMGKLGGLELNYSSDIDLIILYEADGVTNGSRSITNQDYFNRLGRKFVKLLSENTAQGVAYRVDLRLRPGGSKASMAISVASALSYYDLQGRTWEKQALVKARAIAGDLTLGQSFLDQLQGWIYARRFSLTEIQGVKALKRQVERRTLVEGTDKRNLKTGRGGIRDIEFVIQFLQLLHGNETRQLRTGNTLESISRLYEAGCISSQEQTLLDRGYRWLRKLEHRLQIMFDLQTHSLPDDDNELLMIAKRMDDESHNGGEALNHFRRNLNQITDHNRRILDHLLHDAFGEESENGSSEQAQNEVDLVLDPQPEPEWIEKILEPYGFRDTHQAHRHLMDLATEKNVFLSPRRCRHFLAAIAPRLLGEIAATPEPDATLRNLNRVSESLGGKAVLWELFSSHQPSMNLYVRLCATSPYLCDLLTSNPGMVDGLMDSLTMHELPSFEFLKDLLADLLQGAEDIDPIIHSFKDGQHLRVGIRDVLGHDEIRDTQRALSNVAEVCVNEIARREFDALCTRFGHPVADNAGNGQFIIVALGKLGGREPNYHSDLDLVFLYDGEGTKATTGATGSTSNQDFFSRLAANITKRISTAGRYGRLYEIDSRLRPTGRSGSLAVSVNEFTRYFAQGDGQLWERLALCKARPIFCSNAKSSNEQFALIKSLIENLISMHAWKPEFANEILQMRLRMQDGASPHNIKRGEGGTVDVEFAIQMLQLKHASKKREILVPGTLDAADSLHLFGYLATDDFEFLCRSYQMLRWVEARIRLMNFEGRHELPTANDQLAQLAFLLRYDEPNQLKDEVAYLRQENRKRLLRLVEIHSQ